MSAWILIFIQHFALAQSLEMERANNNAPAIQQEGQLVSVRISRKQPVQIFVLGKQEASLDLSTLKLHVRRKDAKASENMPIIQRNGYFVIDESFTQPTDLEITTEVKNKKEIFHIHWRPPNAR